MEFKVGADVVSGFSFGPEFVAPADADNVATRQSISAAQYAGFYGLACRECADADAEAWPDSLEHTMTAYWDKLTADAVKWALAFSRSHLGLGVDAELRGSKSSIVQALVGARVPPVSVRSLQAFVEAFKAHVSGAAPGNRPADGNGDQGDDGTESAGNRREGSDADGEGDSDDSEDFDFI